MADVKKERPRLKNIDDLFIGSEADTLPAGKNAITEIEIDKLTPFRGQHPFRLYEGERLDDMVESIRTNGVLVPIIARKVGEILEILAGHNRVNAAKLAGLLSVPVIILEEINDDDALVYVVETNLIQRGFNDMSHSERAAVIALHHGKMFSQGKRNDIVEHIKYLENPDEYKENSTSAEFRRGLGTRETLASEYGLNTNQVALYKRVDELIEPLKKRLDGDEFALSVAAELSFLNASEQSLIADCMELNKFKVDVKKSDLLRVYSHKGELDDGSTYLILSGEALFKPNATRNPSVKIKTAVYKKYFTEKQSKKEISTIVEMALDMYFAQKTEFEKIFDALPCDRV